MHQQSLARILLVVDGYYPAMGGTELQVALLSAAFQARGHEVQVVVPWMFPERPREELIRGVKTTRISYPHVKGIGALVLMVKFFFWLIKNRHQYDAIHVHMVKNLATVMGLARPFLRDKVMAAKVSGAWEFEGGLLDPALRERFPWSVMNYFVRKLDYFQTISEFTRERMLEAGYSDAKIKMIRNGLPIDDFKKAKRSRAATHDVVTIGFAGRLTPVKGVDVLIAACGELKKRGFDSVELDIAGVGRQRDNLGDQAAALGIGEQVRFLGSIDDMPGFMADIDIYAQPSHQEGLPNSVMQAMAASLPIVATRVSGNIDLINHGKNGYLSPAGDAVAMADSLQALIENAADREAFGVASFAAIQGEYALDTVLDQLNSLYAEKMAKP
jgi:glycosyltransferase involved in cell wall biosynthesis